MVRFEFIIFKFNKTSKILVSKDDYEGLNDLETRLAYLYIEEQ